jgi:hypothetical protein
MTILFTTAQSTQEYDLCEVGAIGVIFRRLRAALQEEVPYGSSQKESGFDPDTLLANIGDG